MKTILYFILLLTRTFTWPWEHLGFRKLLSLEGFDARHSNASSSALQEQRTTTKLAWTHWQTFWEACQKAALILLQHGPLIMALSKQQAASGGKRWNWDWWPSGSGAYQEFPSLHWKGITLHMKTSHISATAVNCDPHSRRQLKTQYLVALLVHSIKDSVNNCNSILYYTIH